MYDKDWYIGAIEEVCDEVDVKVNFMHPKGPGRPQNAGYSFGPPRNGYHNLIMNVLKGYLNSMT